jgi:hypothetical protein
VIPPPRAWLPALALGAFLLLPELAGACAVCISGTDDNRQAFLVTTGLMTVLPLAMVGGFIFWLVRRLRRAALLMPGAPVARTPETTQRG